MIGDFYYSISYKNYTIHIRSFLRINVTFSYIYVCVYVVCMLE